MERHTLWELEEQTRLISRVKLVIFFMVAFLSDDLVPQCFVMQCESAMERVAIMVMAGQGGHEWARLPDFSRVTFAHEKLRGHVFPNPF